VDAGGRDDGTNPVIGALPVCSLLREVVVVN